MNVKKVCKKAMPYIVPHLITLVVAIVLYLLLTYFLHWYGAWLVFIAWWGFVVYRGRAFLAKNFNSGSILKQIEDEKVRVGLIALIVLPFLLITMKGLAGDIKEVNIRNTNWKEVISFDMYNEAVPDNFEVEDYRVEKDRRGYYIVTLHGHVGDETQSVVFYQAPNKVKEYGSMKCDPKWTFDKKE